MQVYFPCCWIWQRRAYSRWIKIWNLVVLKLVLGTKKKSHYRFGFYRLFTSSIQLCFVSFRGPLPCPNWPSSRWSMPCQRHGKRVDWNLAEASLNPRFPCGPAEYQTVVLFVWRNEGGGNYLTTFFPSVHGRPAAELTNSEKWILEGPYSKTLIWEKQP